MVLMQEARLFIEGQAVRPAYNNVRIPGASGTEFSLRDLVGTKARTRSRLTYLRNLTPSSGLRVVYAPLTLSGTGQLSKATQFKDAAFSPSTPTVGSYRFNSYRASYYKRRATASGELRYGVTLKVRDANIALRQGTLQRNEYDLGVVPLLYLAADHRVSNRITAYADFDGSAAPQGRAFDLGLGVGIQVRPCTELLFGLRTLEGGADVDEVYNFARFNYASAGLVWRL